MRIPYLICAQSSDVTHINGSNNGHLNAKSIDGSAVQEGISAGVYSGYSWWRKIVFILRREGTVLTKREITQKLIELEPSLGKKNTAAIRSDSITIMSTLSTKVSKKKLIRVQSQRKAQGRDEFMYGLPEWVDGQGKLKVEYS